MLAYDRPGLPGDLRRRGQAGFVAVDKGEGAAATSQVQRQGTSDSAGRTGDDGHAAGQREFCLCQKLPPTFTGADVRGSDASARHVFQQDDAK